ncbi:MAG TPA: hypothetical protein GX514_06525 [Thermoanaerobacterales bacterium]|uniref:hypothetical protein n=1 Tax=Tepidanaerobacter sp. GT38 TaxID=2722793 RepID=UPI00182F4CCA|nr:hypothetical protein [Tepidanaerobacter sp. GT38]MCG1013357.1 hypothetical protein [Tepidanaerobacter sp. GT38]HHY42484.1 hypothetical protein [Thermoanaerobacterales bacterium]
MTKDELRKALRDIENKKSQLEQQLRQLEEEEMEMSDPLTASIMNAKKTARSAILSGNLKNLFDNILKNMDYAKTAVISLANIADKAQDKLEGKVEEITVASGMSVMTNMWIPMILGLIQTQEFQHLMANMVVAAIKES